MKVSFGKFGPDDMPDGVRKEIRVIVDGTLVINVTFGGEEEGVYVFDRETNKVLHAWESVDE